MPSGLQIGWTPSGRAGAVEGGGETREARRPSPGSRRAGCSRRTRWSPTAPGRRSCAPVGREGGVAGGARGGGQPARRAALVHCRGGHEPDVGGVVVVAVVVADRREHDRAPVGRPRGIGVVVVALGELARRATVRGHHEDLRPPVIGEALAVEPVLHGGDHARRLRFALVLLGHRLRRAAHSRGEGEARAVRRPLGRAQAVPEVGETDGLAAGDRHHVELALLAGLALGDECQAGAVGGPARAGVPSRAGREAARLAAGRAHRPDIGEVLVLLLGERGDHEGDASGRPARSGDR